jgi:hypothetical protein
LSHANIFLSVSTILFLILSCKGYKAPDPSVYNNTPNDFTNVHDLVDYDDTRTTVFPHPLPQTRGLGWNSMARDTGQIDPIVGRQMVQDAYDQEEEEVGGDPRNAFGLDLAARLHGFTEALDILYEQRHEEIETSSSHRMRMVHLTLDTANADLPYLAPPRKIPRTTTTTITTTVPAASVPSTTTTISRRAPRTCKRCKLFGGANATTCKGSKGSFGSKAWYVVLLVW